MLKALFLDMDETLCDTTGANLKALTLFEKRAAGQYPAPFNAKEFAKDYLLGIYKNLSKELSAKLLPITDEQDFRTDLLGYLYQKHQAPDEPSQAELHDMRRFFDEARLRFFDFFPGVELLLHELRKKYCLVVITNGPIYSQHPKAARVKLTEHVDHVIVGGEEPEEKPAISIFQKACQLAKCQAHEALHFGDSLTADIQGAANAGIDSVWINQNGESCQETPHNIPYFSQAKKILELYS